MHSSDRQAVRRVWYKHSGGVNCPSGCNLVTAVPKKRNCLAAPLMPPSLDVVVSSSVLQRWGLTKCTAVSRAKLKSKKKSLISQLERSVGPEDPRLWADEPQSMWTIPKLGPVISVVWRETINNGCFMTTQNGTIGIFYCQNMAKKSTTSNWRKEMITTICRENV